MKMISSLSNPRVKYVRRLQADRRFRSSQKKFVVEGTRWVQELLSNTPLLGDIYYTETWLAQAGQGNPIIQAAVSMQSVTEEVMAAMSATETPPGILATVAINPPPVPSRPSLMLILDGITNPGNLGTMLRTAAAAGVDSALLSTGCVDSYNPKVVRGSMGALLRLPVRQLEWHEIARATEEMRVWVAAAAGEMSYSEVDWRQPSALIVGNEAHGASAAAFALADGSVSIPMGAETESLNAAVAAGIIMFEAARQRGTAGVSS
jgi:TrmH family RNA methyltransferase